MIYNFIYVPIDSYKRNYVVLCKQDLFGYNIIRRNRSKNKNKIKRYILGCRNSLKLIRSSVPGVWFGSKPWHPDKRL